jgi:subtilisin-like proprotein convertase family protein
MGSRESHVGARARGRLRLAGIVALALCLGIGFATGDATAKKKKKHKAPTVFAASVAPNIAIPDQPVSPGHDIIVSSTITVGKKFKGRTVGDVNVTGITTTGDNPTSAGDISFALAAPNGKYVLLNGTSLGGQSIGPLTFDDDTSTSICDSATPTCPDPDATLIRPFAGTANLLGLSSGDLAPLSIMNGSPMRGTWTFNAWDNSNNNHVSGLNAWGLQITAERPVK